MNVAFCPECKKAGLRRKPPNEYPAIVYLLYKKGQRWCPRCKKWVTPEYQKEKEKYNGQPKL